MSSAICGYTEADLDQVLAPKLAGLDRDEIRDWSNGYNWTGETVYNPFDALLLLHERQFRPRWLETATPTFLAEMRSKRGVFLPLLGQLVASEALLSVLDVDHIATEPLLFQTGNLTIDGVRQPGALIEYRLGYLNLEVYASLTDALPERHAPVPQDPALRPSRLHEL